MPNTAAWVDTGFLVALFAREDEHHRSAVSFLQSLRGVDLHSLWPVVTEACFFLDVPGKNALLAWLERGPVRMHEIRTDDLPALRATIEKYGDLSPDFTDAALVTFAGRLGIDAILTVDVRDFSVYRLPSGGSFRRLWR